jgi:hypothetical protein
MLTVCARVSVSVSDYLKEVGWAKKIRGQATAQSLRQGEAPSGPRALRFRLDRTLETIAFRKRAKLLVLYVAALPRFFSFGFGFALGLGFAFCVCSARLGGRRQIGT